MRFWEDYVPNNRFKFYAKLQSFLRKSSVLAVSFPALLAGYLPKSYRSILTTLMLTTLVNVENEETAFLENSFPLGRELACMSL